MRKEEIKKWIVYEGGIVPASNNHFGGESNVNSILDLNIQQRPGELASCINFLLNLKENGENLNYYAEIGACSGGASFAINKFLNFKELLIIDDGGAEAKFYVEERKNRHRGVNLGSIPRIEIIGNSCEKSVIEHANNISNIHKYDILFIDGDHSYEGVRNDTLNYFSIVRKGGYIIFHDVQHMDSISRWLDEIPTALPNLVLVEKFAEADQYTTSFPDGIGLAVFRKLKD